MKQLKLKKLLVFSIALSLLLGLIGLIIFLIISPTLDKVAVSRDYFVYDVYLNNSYPCYYSKNKRNAKEIINYYDIGSEKYRKPFLDGIETGILDINNRIKILDTIDSNTIKFYKITGRKTNSTSGYMGYTHILNIHETPSK